MLERRIKASRIALILELWFEDLLPPSSQSSLEGCSSHTSADPAHSRIPRLGAASLKVRGGAGAAGRKQQQELQLLTGAWCLVLNAWLS